MNIDTREIIRWIDIQDRLINNEDIKLGLLLIKNFIEEYEDSELEDMAEELEER